MPETQRPPETQPTRPSTAPSREVLQNREQQRRLAWATERVNAVYPQWSIVVNEQHMDAEGLVAYLAGDDWTNERFFYALSRHNATCDEEDTGQFFGDLMIEMKRRGKDVNPGLMLEAGVYSNIETREHIRVDAGDAVDAATVDASLTQVSQWNLCDFEDMALELRADSDWTVVNWSDEDVLEHFHHVQKTPFTIKGKTYQIADLQWDYINGLPDNYAEKANMIAAYQHMVHLQHLNTQGIKSAAKRHPDVSHFVVHMGANHWAESPHGFHGLVMVPHDTCAAVDGTDEGLDLSQTKQVITAESFAVFKADFIKHNGNPHTQ